MPTRRTQTWLALLAVIVALPFAVFLGLWGYVAATATPLHPDAQAVPSVAHAAPSPQWADAVKHAQQIARAGLTEQNLPGMSVAVGIRSDLVWAEGFGWADLQNQVKVTPDTLFRIGTTSKVLTSAAVGLLLEKGQLKLDDEIRKYVPEFPEKQWPVTIRQLMANVGGVVPDEGDEEPLSRAAGCERTIDGLRRFAKEPLLFEPGSQYRYSSYGWILVSAAVEAAAKQSFFGFMKAQIFDPLDMHDTMADSVEPMPGRVLFYFPRFGADTRYGPDEPREVDYSCFAGSSAILSTPSDLVRFGIALNTGKLLKQDTVHLLQKSQRLASGQETGYGLGWWNYDAVTLSGADTRAVGYDGSLMGGTVSSFRTFPEQEQGQGIVVAVTANIPHADTSSLALRIAQAFVTR